MSRRGPAAAPGIANPPPGRAPGAWRLPRFGIVVVALAIGALFGYHVAREAFLTDDSFISFRYARNLVDGHGLVWNVGERVEGYTNFLWVLLLAFGMKLSIAPEFLANAVGIAAGSVLLFAIARHLARPLGWSHPATWVAPAILAASLSYAAWCTGGLATTFFALLVFLGVTAYLGERRRGVDVPVRSAGILMLACLTRPDGILFSGIVGVFFLGDVLRGNRSWKSLLVWGGVLTACVGAHFLWRHAYYGYWLPNTFYAKVSGLWIDQGLKYFHLYHLEYRFAFFAPLLLLAPILRRRHEDLLFLGIVLAYGSYLLTIGGDVFEFRFLVFLFPYIYLLLAEGLLALGRVPGPLHRVRVHGAVAVALFLGVFLTTITGGDRSGKRFPYRIHSLEAIRAYTEKRTFEGRYLRGKIEEGLLPRDIVLSMGAAGAVPYYTGWVTVDFFGLNDVEVARMPVGGKAAIGHQRRAPLEYLRRRGVEVFIVGSNPILRRTPRIFLRKALERELADTWKSIRLGEWVMTFASLMSDEEFREKFGHLEILKESGEIIGPPERDDEIGAPIRDD